MAWDEMGKAVAGGDLSLKMTIKVKSKAKLVLREYKTGACS